MKPGNRFDSLLAPHRNCQARGRAGGAKVLLLSIGLLIGGLTGLSGRIANGEDRVAATVDDVPLYVGEVEWIVERAAGEVDLSAAARDRLRADALDRLVRQQLALKALDQQGDKCTQEQLDLAVSRFSDELKRQDMTLDDFCRARRVSLPAFERGMRWRITWDAYLTKMLTKENLQRYYESHRRDFDGTRLQVAQILFTIPPDDADDSLARQKADDLRRQIVAGSLSFGDAARQYSQAPSATAGGDIGWISRREPMPEAFTRAAYQLQEGDVSSSVRSSLGVHLIQCLKIETGTRTWQDVRDELTSASQSELFDRLVDSARGKSRIQYSVDYPHLPPDSKDLESASPDRVESQQSAGK